ncbi:hypothetical protein PGTUg99_003524 [Puccinia graminis f. sp. tritici]|uniref:HAT C-terminal dimerisation domain-containing protein n=1 Tax=Puccinia graminis f. sp. tritici TaxID=56615 RepID=A0A5B0P8W8_PUCGR|nr:hypothetical protein PGTUg99_003524 [Puccinia graminis f. sp. tritici]
MAKDKHSRSAKLRNLTLQLDTVIRQITQSSATRGLFQQTADALGIRCSPLIAGYGIRWNIKYESHKRAILAREVIDKILKDDQESVEKSQRKLRNKNNSATDPNIGIFNDVSFSPVDWQDIEELNSELKVFVKLTEYMEGDHPSGAHVIPKYLELKEDLEEKKNAATESDALYPMYCAMLKRVEKYLEEAMACDSLVLATILHPCYRISLLTLVYGQDSIEVDRYNKLIQGEFTRIKETGSTQATSLQKKPTTSTNPKDSTSGSTDPKGLMARLASLNKKTPSAQEHELQLYLSANLMFKPEDITHHGFALQWWKKHCHLYPNVATLAQRYLATSASSCSVERLLSAASDVCNNSRGSMLPKTMSQSVSSLMWLRIHL